MANLEYRLLAVLALAATQSSCTTIHVHGADAVSTKYYFGFPVIQMHPSEQDAVVVDIRSLGIASTPTGLVAGWTDQTHAAIPPDSRCQTMIWLERSGDISSLLGMLRKANMSLNNICVVKKGGET